MPQITLPDGSVRSFENPVTVYDVAADIGLGLAKAAIAGKVDGAEVDTSFVIKNDANVSLLTERDESALEIIRHSTAHLLAMATQQLFPDTQVTIGPVIEDGFYYDFASDHPFTTEDLERIEKRMQEIASQGVDVERFVFSREEAIATFANMGEDYKVQIIRELPEDEEISVYKQGEWMDLCRGPHVPNTRFLKAFKLMRVSGAYWRGDSNNQMLQRIYGTAWSNKKDLKAYLHQLAEAEKRDHRKIGKKLSLFHIQEEAPGMIFWHPRGWSIYSKLEQYMRDIQNANGYHEVKTPMVVENTLWKKSGHWDKFRENMFVVSSESRDFAVKPMNCPCHVQVYNQGLHSYRDLPMRLAEFGSCHRNELSGALQGLMRVRGFVQDDGHIFCTEEQIQSEVSNFIDLVYKVYADFGFTDVIIKLSTRPEKRVGSDAIWDKSEVALAQALNDKAIGFEYLPGEGAFYGPKIEFSLKDCIGRVWQCGTIQVDFSMPERLEAQYVDANGERQIPVMLHRAILGSFERFIGILIEDTEGSLPAWLAPVQAIVMNITHSQGQYCEKVVDLLKNNGFRVESDLRNEKIGFKIREHTISRIPYLLIVGDKEIENNTVSVRTRSGEDLGSYSVEQFSALLNDLEGRKGRA